MGPYQFLALTTLRVGTDSIGPNVFSQGLGVFYVSPTWTVIMTGNPLPSSAWGPIHPWDKILKLTTDSF